MSHHILSGSHAQGGHSMRGQRPRTPRQSDPVDIDQSLQNANADADDLEYPGSSLEDEFFSPRSSPAPMSPMNNRAEAASPEGQKTPAMPKERFFTPRAPTPEYLKKMVNSHLNCNKSVNVSPLLHVCMYVQTVKFWFAGNCKYSIDHNQSTIYNFLMFLTVMFVLVKNNTCKPGS